MFFAWTVTLNLQRSLPIPKQHTKRVIAQGRQYSYAPSFLLIILILYLWNKIAAQETSWKVVMEAIMTKDDSYYRRFLLQKTAVTRARWPGHCSWQQSTQPLLGEMPFLVPAIHPAVLWCKGSVEVQGKERWHSSVLDGKGRWWTQPSPRVRAHTQPPMSSSGGSPLGSPQLHLLQQHTKLLPLFNNTAQGLAERLSRKEGAEQEFYNLCMRLHSPLPPPNPIASFTAFKPTDKGRTTSPVSSMVCRNWVKAMRKMHLWHM